MAAGRGFYQQNHLRQESLLLAAAAAMSASLLCYSRLTDLWAGSDHWAGTDLWAGTYDNYLSYCHLQEHQGQEIVELIEPPPSSKGLACNGYSSTLVSHTTVYSSDMVTWLHHVIHSSNPSKLKLLTLYLSILC